MLVVSTAIAQAKQLIVREPQTVDLRDVTMVVFELGTTGTITSYANVEPGKLYVFFFGNDNTTLAGSIFLAGGSSASFKRNTSVLFVGDTPTSVRQVADGVTSR